MENKPVPSLEQSGRMQYNRSMDFISFDLETTVIHPEYDAVV
jgi:hypothetical protein